MKNKLKKTMTALCAALIMGGFSVPAYAQGAATEPTAGDATNDSNVVVEEKEAAYHCYHQRRQLLLYPH